MPTTLSPTPAPPRPATRKRFTRDDCEFLERSGLLTGRYELIEGDIVVPGPRKNRTARVAVLALHGLVEAFGVDRVLPRCGLELGPHDIPEPDCQVLHGAVNRAKDYPSPDDVALVVEFADTTLADDLGVKARLYASAGIAEYWVLDVVGRRIVVHRESSADGYAQTLAVAALLPEDDAA